MKRIYITTLMLIALYLQVNAQIDEFKYFVLRAGATHNIMSPQPAMNGYKFVKTQLGEMPLTPTSQYLDYSFGYHVTLYFHYDFPSDRAGFIIGAEYQNRGYSSKYTTTPDLYNVIETYKLASFGVPVLFKFGREIFMEQRYFFVGAQFNKNLSMKKIYKPSWSSEKYVTEASPDEFKENNFVAIVGFNHLVFNIQLEYMPGNFINSDYIANVSTGNEDVIIKPNSGEPSDLFFIKTSINIPLSKWSTKRNYPLYKFMRKIQFWK